MAGFFTRLRRLSMRAGFAAATAFALVPWAEAQWLPFGAAPPREIVERLRAEGYVLVGPLRRRDTVYLADVAGGPLGRERLVIDAWSGEILQRFVERRGGFAPEGGEFSEPPPLGPPPPRDFREGNYGYGSEGPGVFEAPPRSRPRSRPRPAATARKSMEPKQPAAELAPPQNAGTSAPAPPAPAGAAAPSATVSPPGAAAHPNVAEPAKAEPSPPKASTESAKEAQPQPAAASTPAESRQALPAPANSSPAPLKPGEKKVNDLPVNPLD